jgi:hypothetical protein
MVECREPEWATKYLVGRSEVPGATPIWYRNSWHMITGVNLTRLIRAWCDTSSKTNIRGDVENMLPPMTEKIPVTLVI